MLLASAKGCAQLKQRPLAQLSSQALARAPADYPSLAPLLASTRLLQKERLSLNDIDLWELPDAPALALLANLAAWQDARFCERQLELEQPMGRLDPTSSTRGRLSGAGRAAGQWWLPTTAATGRHLASPCTGPGAGVRATRYRSGPGLAADRAEEVQA
ncbi:hypothetical protein ULG90_22020 [Halopseudomonas pachastrellae]|nr:hypothetical protein ULG90_22020 [Halopseudomonas pachastrellae]